MWNITSFYIFNKWKIRRFTGFVECLKLTQKQHKQQKIQTLDRNLDDRKIGWTRNDDLTQQRTLKMRDI